MTASSLYLIEAENGVVKIGRAQKPTDRVVMIRAHSPVRVRLIAVFPGGEREERGLHERFVAFRSHGEWFAQAGDCAAFVAFMRGQGVERIPDWSELAFASRDAFLASGAYAPSPKRRGMAKPRRGAPAGTLRVGLTAKQTRTLALIREYIAEHGYAPSYHEIAQGLGVASKSGVHRLVYALVERGHVSLLSGAARAIVLTSAENPPEPRSIARPALVQPEASA